MSHWIALLYRDFSGGTVAFDGIICFEDETLTAPSLTAETLTAPTLSSETLTAPTLSSEAFEVC